MSQCNNRILSGNLAKAIVYLAIPAILSQLSMTFLNLSDRFWVSKLGTEDIAAVGSSFFIIGIITALMQVFHVGTLTLVAQSTGRKNFNDVQLISLQALGFGFIASLLIVILGLVFLPSILSLMGLSIPVVKLTLAYLNIILIAGLLYFVIPIQDGILKGYGNTKTPMIIITSITLVNFILDPVLIFGWMFFPKLGIKGAAYATAISQIIGFIVFVLYLNKNNFSFRISIFSKVRPCIKSLLKIIKIGLPPSLASIVFMLVYVVLIKMISTIEGTQQFPPTPIWG